MRSKTEKKTCIHYIKEMSVYQKSDIYMLNMSIERDARFVTHKGKVGEKSFVRNNESVYPSTPTKNSNDNLKEMANKKESQLPECDLNRGKREVNKLLKTKQTPFFCSTIPVSTKGNREDRKGNRDTSDNLMVHLIKSINTNEKVKDSSYEDFRNDVDKKIEDINNKKESVKSSILRLFLINFEDDTFKPVIGIGHKQINIINSWYEKCGQIIDIEETDIEIPKNVEKIFKNIIQGGDNPIECKHKNTFIQSYIPEILNVVTTQDKLRTLCKTMNSVSYINIEINSDKKSEFDYSNLDIVIPDNLIYLNPYFYTGSNEKVIILDKYQKKRQEENKGTDNYEGFVQKLQKSSYGCITFPDSHEKKENKEEEIKSYNEDYDVLKPYFGTNCFKVSDETDNLDVKPNYLIIVLFNPLFFQTVVVVSPDLLTIETIFEHTDYGFVELFTISTNDVELETLIKKQYDGVIFNNAEELNNTLSSTSNFIEYIKTKKPNQISEEEILVKEYFTKFYTITDDINKKMKASTLYDNIIKQQVCKFNNDTCKQSGFKNRLSVYFKNMGLQKKRYNDGYYYYGISPIHNYVYNMDRVESLEVILKKRLDEMREFDKKNVNELFTFRNSG